MKKVLLFTTALTISFIQHNSLAQSACISTPTCSELGYTESSCPNGGLKCPFGNTWNCEISNYKDKITELEKELENLEQSSNGLEICNIGDILYSDKTCSADVLGGKIPIGVVFDTTNMLAIGLSDFSGYWSVETDIPELNNLSGYEAIADWQGKRNTQIVLNYCQTNGIDCYAFETVKNYTTEGTQAGDWYLPAEGELYAVYRNKYILDRSLGKIKGTQLSDKEYRSSSEESDNYVWYISFDDGGMGRESKLNMAAHHRPIINYGQWANITPKPSETCDIGYILYSDKTCNIDMVATKTPIGVVFDINKRLAIALDGAQNYWSSSYFDVSDLNNITTREDALIDEQGKDNTKIVLDYCTTEGEYSRAFNYANDYQTEGTQAGDWYLPSLGELNDLSRYIGVIDFGLDICGGLPLKGNVWSSTEYSDDNAWYFDFTYTNGFYDDKMSRNIVVRPVLAF